MNAPVFAPPSIVSIAGVEMTLVPGHPHGVWWRGPGSGASSAWQYGGDDKSVPGQFGCTVDIGGATIGGIAPTIEALDATCREKIEKTRAALAPTADAWLADCVERALVAFDDAMGEKFSDGEDLIASIRAAFAARARERFAQPAQCIALVLPYEATFAPQIDEDSRRAIPDACEVDEPAEGDMPARVACKCGEPGTVEMHSCPYQSEIYGDEDPKCHCCDGCRSECSADV